MKKVLTCILAVCLCFSTVFAFASCGCENKSADESYKVKATEPDMTDENGIGYVAEGDELTTTSFTGKATELTIPSEFKGKKVTKIGNSTFKGSALQKAVIPNTVTVIGEHAFSMCTDLSDITIPDSVKTIEISAFLACSSLKQVKLPSSVESIGQTCFSGSGLEKIEIPEKVTTIQALSFYQCFDLTSVIVTANVTSVEKDAFGEDDKLVITGPSGCAVETYAKEHSIQFTAK